MALLPNFSSLLPSGAVVVPVRALPRLAFDHDRIVAFAVEDLRARYREHPDPSGLLEERFTLSQLRGVPEAVLGEELQPSRPPHLRAWRGTHSTANTEISTANGRRMPVATKQVRFTQSHFPSGARSRGEPRK